MCRYYRGPSSSTEEGEGVPLLLRSTTKYARFMFFWGWSVFSNQQQHLTNKSELASNRHHNESRSTQFNNNHNKNRSIKATTDEHHFAGGCAAAAAAARPLSSRSVADPLMASPLTSNRKPLITISSPLSGTYNTLFARLPHMPSEARLITLHNFGPCHLQI